MQIGHDHRNDRSRSPEYALITPSQADHPFGEHTPRLWQHYPFRLTQHVVGLDANDRGLSSVLEADPHTPHWTDSVGYRLFDSDGNVSPFLKRTLTGLRDVQQEVTQTQQLIWRLHGLRVLTPCEVYHAGQLLPVYRIEMDRLMELIGHLESKTDLRLTLLATYIEQSQKDMGIRNIWLISGYHGEVTTPHFIGFLG